MASAAVPETADDWSIEPSATQRLTPMSLIVATSTSARGSEIDRYCVKRQQGALGIGDLEADRSMVAQQQGTHQGGARIGWRRMTMLTTRMAAPQQRQTKVGTAVWVVCSATGWGCGALSKARALTRFSRRPALASRP